MSREGRPIVTEVVRDAVTISAQPRAVMDVILDYEDYPQWQSKITAAKVLRRDSAGRGDRVRFAVEGGGFQAVVTLAYVYGDDAVRWSLHDGRGVRRLDGAYVLAEVGGATHVSYELAVEPSIAVPGFVRRKAARRILESALHGLKERMEAPLIG